MFPVTMRKSLAPAFQRHLQITRGFNRRPVVCWRPRRRGLGGWATWLAYGGAGDEELVAEPVPAEELEELRVIVGAVNDNTVI